MEEEEEENIIIDKADRISQLPESIIHQIFPLLYSQESISQMSVLSKDWFALTASFPILTFKLNYAYGKSQDKFFKYVAYTTFRFCEQNVSAHTFDIAISHQSLTEVDILDRCLGLILKKGLQVLKIMIYLDKDQPMYRLPNILLSASSLTSLIIQECELPSSLMVDGVKFKSLKLLSLNLVPIDEGVIKCLTTSCPLLEEINLVCCYGFKRFCVFGHQNLKKVVIYCKNEVERVDIEAPNLCYLFWDNFEDSATPSMNLASCKKLSTVCYNGFLSKTFTDFLSSFPFIENLLLFILFPQDNLKLPIHSLRRLKLHSYFDLDEIEINTRNLLLFECYVHLRYEYHHVEYDPFERVDSTQSKTCLKIYRREYVDTLWFHKLRQFLDKNNGFKILKLVLLTQKLVDVEELKAIQSSPYVLELVELKPDSIQEIAVSVALVDAVLWCCQPRVLTLGLDDYYLRKDLERRNHVVQYTYEKLLQQEDQGQINIQIVLCYSSEIKQNFSDLNSCLGALTCDEPISTITFIKEHGVSEEAG